MVLVDDKRSYGYLPLEVNRYADSILEYIDRLLKKAKITVKDLTGIFVVIGPGSFTGLRVGIAIANQFAHQLNIPIIGLKTNVWWSYRTDEKSEDYVFLQSMNRAEVYTAGGIKPVEAVKGDQWIGQLSEDHREKLQHLHELHEMLDVEKTWLKITGEIGVQKGKQYELLEPFYGKNPTITKSKRNLTIRRK